MLEYSKLPDRQGRPAQKQQLYTAPAAYGVSRTNIRSNFRSDQDEHDYPVQCIPQQSLFYGADISWSSDNAATAPIQMLTIGEAMNIDNLEQYVDYLEQNSEPGLPDAQFCSTMKELRNLLDLKEIPIASLQYDTDDKGKTFIEIENLVRNYYLGGSDPWENIKRLAESYSDCFFIYNKKEPVKIFLKKIDDTFGKSKFVHEMVSDFLKQNSASLEWYLQFGQAVAYHAGTSRNNYSSSEIGSTDINDVYDPGKACVISALMYAEGSIFGDTDVKELHRKLTYYFNTYPGCTKENNSNVRNYVWKNYSDDKVYPSMYDFFGYQPIYRWDRENPPKTLVNVYNELKGQRGIIIIESKTGKKDNKTTGHAIGFQCTSDGTMTLRDNESTNSGQLFSSHQNRVVFAIYVKQL